MAPQDKGQGVGSEIMSMLLLEGLHTHYLSCIVYLPCMVLFFVLTNITHAPCIEFCSVTLGCVIYNKCILEGGEDVISVSVLWPQDLFSIYEHSSETPQGMNHWTIHIMWLT